MPQASTAVADRPQGASRRPPAGSDFAPLLRTVKAQGLLERRTGWYARSVIANAAALTAVAVGLFALGHTWWVLLLAPVLSVLCVRTAFIGHDAGHSQITGNRTAARLIGLFHGNLLLGMSVSWWNDKHNRHHANPNHIEKDPDVAADVLVFTSKQAGVRVGFRRWLTRHQAWLFFPLTLLQGIAMKVYGFQGLRRQSPRGRAVEGTLLVAHLVGYGALLLAAMPLGHALAFAALHQALFGLHLGMAFAPNHKGMEMPNPDGEHWGHLQRQVLTSRNIRGGQVTDWLLGGLNYQIEHHLFPSMPRPHLRLAQPLVRAHCHAVGMPYAETGLIDSYRQVLRHMYEVGEPLRAE
ncbi:acyl-CoA desaturase [Streptomyces spectabilis]|uniref:Acyl-CoA desaturase n=1 Tax=Streptomyces spectabilis TaxID=68270 RepID=A0A5P2XGI1_STRST|nr:acyl-CoA desaturase [Streptomyces spectabilis]MBB5105665.1 fatty acid desaturase [Streptomyces spectabilis]MCI3906837.1 acyl-CoA desaturase [Streptomyces spectabilis]QEV63631.1 acyl-CoA desaturase [Streptomyces spectabilis]GGV23086.1 fatty acid desaturase [Streptomyces spectabilis]